MAKYIWTQERPKEPGWYWIRIRHLDGKFLKSIVYIWKDNSSNLYVDIQGVVSMDEAYKDGILQGSFWAGPIEEAADG